MCGERFIFVFHELFWTNVISASHPTFPFWLNFQFTIISRHLFNIKNPFSDRIVHLCVVVDYTHSHLHSILQILSFSIHHPWLFKTIGVWITHKSLPYLLSSNESFSEFWIQIRKLHSHKCANTETT